MFTRIGQCNIAIFPAIDDSIAARRIGAVIETSMFFDRRIIGTDAGISTRALIPGVAGLSFFDNSIAAFGDFLT